MSALFPVEKDPQRLTKYPHYKHHLKCDGLKFPMSLDQINKFEKMNPQLSINVYGYKDTFLRGLEIFPVRVSSNTAGKKIDLLAVENGNSHHFCWIKNLAKLNRSGVTKHEHKIFLCDRCLNYFATDGKLQQHSVNCGEKEAVRVRMPKTDDERFVEFQKFSHQEPIPYIVYADFEALLVPQHHEVMEMDHGSYTQNIQKHIPYSAYHGTGCSKWFVKELEQVAYTLEKKIKHIEPIIPLTIEQEMEFLCAEKCHICKKSFTPTNSIRVHDHSHITGYYRGPAHQICNLNYQNSKVIPVVMHNLSGYDAHFIIEPLLTEFDGHVDVSDDEQFQLLTRKGVFPYEYMSSWERLDEVSLPTKEAFYSALTDEHITDQDYNHAIQVRNTFGLHTLGEYSDLFMKTDVFLLADIFENFRKTCLHNYGLDPAHSYTLAGYTWEAMLKYTDKKLELFTEVDKFRFIERRIRGGVSHCSNRYAKANNKYMTEGYNPNETQHYLMYYDVVNEYGAAMSTSLPTGNFEWVDTPDFMEIADDSPVGFILDVDLEILQNLHDYFSDLPPCPEIAKQ
ncbi:uncharacterized protein LOC123302553 [Chrysoperla carnea]|uniref:uncharacterized protein LOC123302553 n=1 Tax=Chrysoperla carnea TaxID=189513 RepID=UPI001D065D23|nr:uncharacterized protein LOC123302553 [Chrysoperla carnea]